MIFFYKQKTADEMRISDWSSDVCSSDLRYPTASDCSKFLVEPETKNGRCSRNLLLLFLLAGDKQQLIDLVFQFAETARILIVSRQRSDERRVGKECVSTSRIRWSQ